MRIDLVLVGFGNVGRRFVRLLLERSEPLAREHDLSWRVTGIATRRHGVAFDPSGLSVQQALAIVERGGPLATLNVGRAADTVEDLLHRCAAAAAPLVLVETTTLDIARGQPAIDHVRAAFAARAHVMTANKGPVAFAYRDLAAEARRAGVAFLFEGAVMDGIPIFNLVRETLPAVRIVGFRGIVNSTTNYVLTEMEAGRAARDAVGDMQAAGIAEADPSHDLDGWDAAAKTAALINVLMDGDATPQSIDRTGIASLARDEVHAAAGRHERIRLVASAERRGGTIVGRVAPVSLPETDPLAQLRGTANGLILKTDLLGEIGVMELDSGLTQTAYALLSDLVTVRRRL